MLRLRDEPHRQVLVAVDDVVHRPGGLADELDAFHAIEQRLEHRSGFQPGQPLTCAGMGAVAKADVTAGVVADVECIGVSHSRSSRLAEAYSTSTRAPAGILVSLISLSLNVFA